MNNLSSCCKKLKELFFVNPKSGWLWLIVRLYLGQFWLVAGYHKFTNPVWFGGEAGGAIKGFVAGALVKTGGEHPDVTWWYGWFLENCVATIPAFWSHLITVGEIATGLGLIFGVLTALATAGGLLMNFNFMLSGVVSANPVMVLLGVPLLLAYRVSGNIGVQKFLSDYLKKRKSTDVSV